MLHAYGITAFRGSGWIVNSFPFKGRRENGFLVAQNYPIRRVGVAVGIDYRQQNAFRIVIFREIESVDVHVGGVDVIASVDRKVPRIGSGLAENITVKFLDGVIELSTAVQYSFVVMPFFSDQTANSLDKFFGRFGSFPS